MGIGEHPQHIEEIDKLFSWIEDSLSDCVDKLAVNSGSIYAISGPFQALSILGFNP